MNTTLWPRVSELMHRALDVPSANRRRWVEEHADGDSEVTTEVLRLLAADSDAGDFLEDPLIAAPGAANAVRAALPLPQASLGDGSLVGPYRILREIGRGGMGTVYLAARADDVFEKTVAVKVAPGGLGSDGLRELFTRERQVLAALDHPGIARVLDGGDTSTGLQYLVMEFVDGTPIDRYCDARRLDVRARLRLFTEVCAAVQYAHDHLIVHRDIKPSNVLVGDDGRARLLDFGIAKILARDASAHDVSQTLAQAWTPESASPEQVRGEPTSVATDVYGLGALLYRLLTGRTVFDLSGADRVERARIVCEDAPRPPSAVPAGDGVARSEIGGDLDLIVLKALQKEPSRRYRSATHLAEDLERYLAHEPVLAAPDRLAYRARKFVGRHPVATLATAVAGLAILVATGTALWQARRADEERNRAQSRLADVRRLASTLIFDVYDRVENSPNATTIRRSLVEKGLGYLDGFTSDASTDVGLSLELAEGYRRLASVQGGGNANLGDRDGALVSLTKATALLEPFRTGPDVPLEVEIADLRLLRETTLLLASDPERRRTLAAEIVERADRLATRHPERLDVLEVQGLAYFYAAQAATSGEKLSSWTKANRVYDLLVSRVPGEPSHLRSLALTEKYLGAAYFGADRRVARRHYERALELDRKVQALRPNSRQTMLDIAIDLGSVAAILRREMAPRLSEAASLFRESLALRERAAAQDPQDVFARQGIGYCLIELSDLSRRMHELENAAAYARRATEIYDSLPASDNVTRRGQAWLALGRAEFASGRTVEGCAAYRKAHVHLAKAIAAPPDGLRKYADQEMAFLAKALPSCPP